ncbi:alpha-N-acetylgalactosaminide alpha-2,6-sialyltransferase 3-like [Saccoglossus kowalevskii]
MSESHGSTTWRRGSVRTSATFERACDVTRRNIKRNAMKIKKQIIVRVLAATVITCAVIYTTTNQHEANVAYEKEVHKYRFIEVNQIEKERITKMFSNNSFGFVRMKNESEVLNLHCDICAIVTSSGQLLGSGAGAEIDKNTCVIRMNTAPTRGYEKDVGTKTTLRMFSFVNLQQQLFEKEQFFEQEGITGTFVIWSTTVKEILSMVEEESLRLLKQYPSLDLYISSFEQMDFADRVFRQETGQDRAASGSWLSTGWYTLLLALTMCEHVKVYGMVESDYCHNVTLINDMPHHYFDASGPKECVFSRLHEYGLREGHRFHTEKYIFKKWARVFNITFHHPSWDLDHEDNETRFLLHRTGRLQ